MNCYISKNYKNKTNAGNKAKTDIEQIMKDMGFKNVGLPQSTHHNKVLSFFITLIGILKAPFCLNKGDILVMQYPLKKYFSFVCNMAHLRGAKVVTLIHDLGSFRRKALTIKQEIKRLNHSDYIIAHNDKMRAWLLNNGITAPLGILEIFDYLSKTKATRKETNPPYNILYAGGLNPRKNTFLYEIGEHIKSYGFNLYGNGFDATKAKRKEHFKYMGFVKSDDLIATAQGDFGLVWDGFSISSCTGDFGEYLQYNNPHKTSLYIRCELPVIIWSKAALADFILKHNIGFAVDSLEEIEPLLANLSKERYEQMRHNTTIISDKLANGYFARTAISTAVSALTNQESLYPRE